MSISKDIFSPHEHDFMMSQRKFERKFGGRAAAVRPNLRQSECSMYIDNSQFAS